jgi:hypothetical protein
VSRLFGDESRIGTAGASEGMLNRFLAQTSNIVDDFAYGTLKYSGFNMVERWNRQISGATALYQFNKWLYKGYHGKLRGVEADIARRSALDLGVDLDKLLAKAKLRGGSSGERFFGDLKQKLPMDPELAETLKLVTLRGAQRTQFVPSQLRRPVYWNTPTGRAVFQFKSFALQQGRFIRDRVLSEYALGNVRPMAYFMSVYPVAGEAVNLTRHAVRGRDFEASGVGRFVSDMLAVGGLGLASDVFVQAKFGRFAEYLMGPAAGDVSTLAENIAQGDGNGLLRQVTQLPLVDAVELLAKGGIVSAELGLWAIEQLQDEESPGTTTVDLGQFQFDQTQRKAEREPKAPRR